MLPIYFYTVRSAQLNYRQVKRMEAYSTVVLFSVSKTLIAIECSLFNLSICIFSLSACSGLKFLAPLNLALASSVCL